MSASEFVFDRAAYKQWLEDNTDAGTGGDLRKPLRIALEQCVTETQRKYLVCYIADSMTIYQIAELYSVNPSTVSRTIERGFIRLFRYLRFTSPRLYDLEFTKTDLRVRRKGEL